MPQQLLTDRSREQAVFGQQIPWDDADHLDGVRGQFAHIGPLGPMERGIDPETARTLIENEHLDPRGTQNRSPTMNTLVSLGEAFDIRDDVERVEFRGYMIGPGRPDTRITLTSIKVYRAPDADEFSEYALMGFQQVCHNADEYVEDDDYLSAWWD